MPRGISSKAARASKKKTYVAMNDDAKLKQLAIEQPVLSVHPKLKMAITLFWEVACVGCLFNMDSETFGFTQLVVATMIGMTFTFELHKIPAHYRAIRNQPNATKFNKAIASGKIVEVDPKIVAAVSKELGSDNESDVQQLLQSQTGTVSKLHAILPILAPESVANNRNRTAAQQQFDAGIKTIASGNTDDPAIANYYMSLTLGIDPEDVNPDGSN